jgi:hypothetical protein
MQAIGITGGISAGCRSLPTRRSFGRLFRTNVDQRIKRNLIIFVTARLINPGGQPVNSTDEIEESENVIELPILPEVPFYKK